MTMKLASRIFRRTDWYVTSPFGMRKHPVTGENKMHNGTDYGTYGQKWPQYALENGTVLSAGKDSTGAIFAWVRYPRLGIEVLYYHLDALYVKAGQAVSKDTVIGNTGTTGVSTGIHLHLGMRKSGTTANLDPHAYDYTEASVNPAPAPALGKNVDEIAREVIAGKWGNGDDRKQKLTAAGYDASAVQNRVNEILRGGSASVPAPTPTPTVSVIFKKGDRVKIKPGAKWYNGTSIPEWVMNDTWIVYQDQSGDRVVLDRNLSGKSSIMSPIKAIDLIKQQI